MVKKCGFLYKWVSQLFFFANPSAVDGQWTEWNPWQDCSTTCGPGTKERHRYCTDPAPLDGGEYCPGDKVETMACDLGSCSSPVDGVWSIWADWAACSLTCGDGTQTRSRTCDNPAPSNGGADCVGSTDDTQACNDGACPGNFFSSFICTDFFNLLFLYYIWFLFMFTKLFILF